jgi:bifunctional UDP-N-acetylglucosamine pyrophosphorylase/glucosamine-1-phosphate N-acetyltransferase
MSPTYTKVLILAAGKGTRMNAALPKLLHMVAGRTLLDRVLGAVTSIDTTPLVVLGHAQKEIEPHLPAGSVVIEQAQQLGTGHAVMMAEEQCRALEVTQLLVVAGDHPFMNPASLAALSERHASSDPPLTITTLRVPHFDDLYSEFYRFGRIVRDLTGHIQRITEFKDAAETERDIREVNVGYYAFDTDWLFQALKSIRSNNIAGEYYLTDLVAVALEEGYSVETVTVPSYTEAVGVNTPEDLANAERIAANM